MSIQQDTNLEITASAQEALQSITDQAWEHARLTKEPDTLAMASFAACLVGLTIMGGRLYKESDTMFICNTRSGMVVGMHFDGKEWSLHS